MPTKLKPVRNPTAPSAKKARSVTSTEPTAARKHKRTAKPRAPERVAAILEALQRAYPDAVCALTHTSAWQLVIATALSAQTTDVTVNTVTPALFKAFPTPRALAAASLPEIESIIHRTGFYRAKARNIQGAARVVVENFGGKVPQTLEELITLPGVARKTANVVLGSWFKIASGVVVDTHVLRISKRLELTTNTDPVKVERDLIKIIPQDQRIDYSHRIIYHGRQICLARKPRCADCSLETLCNAPDKTWSSH